MGKKEWCEVIVNRCKELSDNDFSVMMDKEFPYTEYMTFEDEKGNIFRIKAEVVCTKKGRK